MYGSVNGDNFSDGATRVNTRHTLHWRKQLRNMNVFFDSTRKELEGRCHTF